MTVAQLLCNIQICVQTENKCDDEGQFVYQIASVIPNIFDLNGSEKYVRHYILYKLYSIYI